MSTAPTPEMETLKSRLKATWEAGDFAEVAKHIGATAEEFVERSDVKPGMKVLDVACGSGNLAVVAAAKGADVTGVDIAENLIGTARKRAAGTPKRRFANSWRKGSTSMSTSSASPWTTKR